MWYLDFFVAILMLLRGYCKYIFICQQVYIFTCFSSWFTLQTIIATTNRDSIEPDCCVCFEQYQPMPCVLDQLDTLIKSLTLIYIEMIPLLVEKIRIT